MVVLPHERAAEIVVRRHRATGGEAVSLERLGAGEATLDVYDFR